MIDLEDKLEGIKKQQEQAKELFVKCQGAIELLTSLIKEQKSSEEKDFEKEKK